MVNRDKIVVSGDYVRGDKNVFHGNVSDKISENEIRQVASAWPQLNFVGDVGMAEKERISDSPFFVSTTEVVASGVDGSLRSVVRPAEDFEKVSEVSIFTPLIRKRRAIECIRDGAWVNFVADAGQGKTWLLRQVTIFLSKTLLGDSPEPQFSGVSEFANEELVPLFFDFHELREETKIHGNVFSAMSNNMARYRAQKSLYERLIDSGNILVVLDNVPDPEEDTDREVLQLLASALNSRSIRGVVSSSRNELLETQIAGACEFTEKRISPPDRHEVEKIINFFRNDPNNIFRGDLSCLAPEMRSNLRLLRIASTVISLESLASYIDVHSLTRALLDLASKNASAKGETISFNDLEKAFVCVCELCGNEGSFSTHLANLQNALSLSNTSSNVIRLNSIVAELASVGLLKVSSASFIKLTDERFAHSVLARQIVSKGGARDVFLQACNESGDYFLKLALAIVELKHYDVNLLGCMTLVNYIRSQEDAIFSSLSEKVWLLFFQLIFNLRQSSYFSSDDERIFADVESFAIQGLVLSDRPIMLKCKAIALSCPVTRSCFKFVEIPPAAVDLGENSQEIFELDYSFWIMKYPISQYEYYRLIEGGHPDRLSRQYPMTNVSWIEAVEFCERYSAKILELAGLEVDGFHVRLPTEAEWKLAFRGGLQLDGKPNPFPRRPYPWGGVLVNDGANSPSLLRNGRVGLMPNGLWPDNVSPYGVKDMLGNCMEWSNTAWGGSDPSSPKFGRPYSASDGREDGCNVDLRLALGGSWLFDDSSVKCACRLSAEARHLDVGFRPVAVPL